MTRRPLASLRPAAGLVHALTVATMVFGPWPSATPAAEPPPALVARFTRSVQPLLLNRCAAGACHGGQASPPPQLRRGIGGHVDRGLTLANIDALATAAGPGRDPGPFLATISSRHPATAAASATTATPLTPQERATLEGWLRAALASPAAATAHPSANVETPLARPNRLRALLDAAAHPAPLPPPQEAPGLILGREGEDKKAF